MAKEKQGALYMVDKDNARAVLVAGDDVEDRKAEGYTVLEGKRGDNGEDWNRPEDQGARDIAADLAKTGAKLAAVKAEEEAKEREGQFRQAETVKETPKKK